MPEMITKPERWHKDGCYCALWEKSPETLEEKGIPRGYCGVCSVCGKPGHTMHFPGSAPFTGTWCKYHYYRTMIFHPLGNIGTILWLGIAAGVAVSVYLITH